jgi:hypothetical protein
MHALAPSQCSAWLARRQVRETPTTEEVAGGQYVRLTSVATPGVAMALVESLGRPIDVLLQLTDSSVFGLRPVPSSLSLLDERAPATGDWPQHSTRGLVFAEGDEPALRECCEYVLAEGASAYLYAPHAALTIGLWESEFIELWCPETATINAVVQRLALHSVREIKTAS